ncbi:carbohydrate-binding module family 13 protein [Rhizophagus irregularis DAOM 181602=DAOM 197198]|nr:carbohydrate-binding module family 13 protein [Rhizophagus irregularis DAOM 181602=DAOM 197198]
MADNKFLSKLTQNLLEILDDEEYYDITIEVAHIKLPNISPETFQIILRYIYSGRLSLVNYDILDIIKILVAASELNLQELIPYLQLFLIKNETKWVEKNFAFIYKTSFKNDSFLELQKFCTELISKQPEKIFNSSDFTSIPEKALISLIQHNGNQISEVQVWEHVLKWGIAQNPEISSDPSSYSNDDFNALKNTLRQIIPLIKFTEFTSKEFLNKVYPYKKIIPDELNEDLVKSFLDNDYKPNKKSEPQIIKKEVKPNNIDSKIITRQHAELISKWIDRLGIADELKNSYEFKLILRGSRDGFTPEKFHEICDNKSHTITIIKVKDSNEILGGYNPIEWKSDSSYGITKDSFIFSFKNNDNYILSRVKDEKHAINNYWNYGPSFGDGDINIVVYSNNVVKKINKLINTFQGSPSTDNTDRKFNYCYCSNANYEIPIRKTDGEYTIEEYEIFQIAKDI